MSLLSCGRSTRRCSMKILTTSERWVVVAVLLQCARALRVGEERPSSDPLEERNLSKAKFFGAGYSTQTHTIVSFTTSTVPLTCLAGTASGAEANVPARCTGKRKKRAIYLREKWDVDPSDVESSLGLEPAPEVEVDGKSRHFFTVWTKIFTTTTLTSFSTDSATTLSVSYYCSAGNIQLPDIGC